MPSSGQKADDVHSRENCAEGERRIGVCQPPMPWKQDSTEQDQHALICCAIFNTVKHCVMFWGEMESILGGGCVVSVGTGILEDLLLLHCTLEVRACDGNRIPFD